MADDTPPTREELLKAREDLKEQLNIVENPIRGGDYNPVLVARLKSMIYDIDVALANTEETDARGS